MTHVIAEPCIGTKDTACVDVCPVDCIHPTSDEGAYDGDPCQDPGDDRSSITHAIAIAQANNVIVSPIAATGSSACVVNLTIALAEGTGGTAFRSVDPQNEIADFVLQLIENACLGTDVSACEGEQLRVFDDRGSLDDEFEVYLDGELLFRTSTTPGTAAPCINNIPPGRHTLRIVFARDIDDPDGNDEDEDGDFGIVLLNGVTFVDGPGVETPVTATGENLWPQGTDRQYTIDVPGVQPE